jgi:hypothetical protein
MKGTRIQIEVSYRVLDPLGKTLDVIKQTGLNGNLIQWMVERKVLRKYGKEATIQKIRVERLLKNRG